MHGRGLLLLDIEIHSELCEVPNAMELSSKLDQATCFDTHGGNSLESMQETKLDDEGNPWIDGKQETSPISEVVSEKVDSNNSNSAPSNTDTQTSSTSKGELCGLYTQVSIGYVDIFEVLRDEILAAEARELEVDGLLMTAREDFEESSTVEADEGTDVREPTVAATERPDPKGDALKCSFHGNTTDVGDKDGPEDQLNSAEVREGRVAQDHEVVEDVEHTEPCTTTQREGSIAHTHHHHQPGDAEEVGHVGLAQDHQGFQQVDDAVEPLSEGTSGQAQQNGSDFDREETNPSPLNRDLTGDTLSEKDNVAATDLGHDTPLDKLTGDNDDDDDDHRLPPADISDRPSEHSDDEDYSRSTFSGPIAFSGMLSYSGLIPYSGQIPHSGNMSLHSDSSTSMRSFAFPILSSDWNSSPAKIGQPDGRYFRRRRRWRPSCCCRRPTTLFD